MELVVSIELVPIEPDFLGDLASGPRDLWEWYQFVRRYYPNTPETEVVKIGRDILKMWIDRGWLEGLPEPKKLGEVMSGRKVLEFIDKRGLQAADPRLPTIQLKLTEQAFKDVDWLLKE